MLLGSFLLGRRTAKEAPQPIEIIRTDTLWITDTIREIQPKIVRIREVDTMLLHVIDTVHVNDTIQVTLPRTQAFYQDTTYRAWVSGYRPQLDSIEVYQKEKIVTITERVNTPPKRWGIGVQAGYGVTFGKGTWQGAPYVGIGVSYDLIRF